MRETRFIERVFSRLFMLVLTSIAGTHLLLHIIIGVKSERGAERYSTMVWISLLVSLVLVFCAVCYQSRTKLRFAIACSTLNTIGTALGCIVGKNETAKMVVVYTVSLGIAVAVPFAYRVFEARISKADPKVLRKGILLTSIGVYVLLIVAGLITGKSVGGNIGSLRIGGISLQLTQLQTVLAVLYCSVALSDYSLSDTAKLACILFYLGANTAGLMSVGETGLLLVIAMTTILMIYVCLRSRVLFWVSSVLIMLLGGTCIWAAHESYVSEASGFISGKLASLYQRMNTRLALWFDPGAMDPFAEGYQYLKASDAIALGGWLGTDHHIVNVPNQHNDYIFTALILRFGAISGIVTIMLFLVVLFDGMKLALRIGHEIESNIAFGLTFVMVVQSMLMLSGSIGAIPMTGVPVAFYSESGVCTALSFCSVSFILNAEKLCDTSKGDFLCIR